jgi:3',5'-cyclic AMP phosphodiesterase CpdA
MMLPPARPRSVRSSARAAAGALLVGLAIACVHDVHRIGPIAAPPPARPAAVRALVFGDFGYRTVPQRLVARAMRRESEARPFDLAVQVGDNVYKCGPNPTLPGAERCRFDADGAAVIPGAPLPDDPAFALNEAPLRGLVARGGGPLPVYLALGNHDVAAAGGCAVPGLSAGETARRRACLSVARRTPTWTMPARHYVVDRGPVRLVFMDTNVVTGDYGGFTLADEIAFVRAATAPCSGAAERGSDGLPGGARQCFLVGHHPPAAVHGYGRGRAPRYGPRMARLVAAAGDRARAFFGGHVHTLEHLTVGSLDVFVSGSTAMGGYHRFRYRWPPAAQLRFATSAWGYAVLEADAEGYRVSFADFRGEPLHCCAAGRTGPCLPVDCG